MVPPNLGKITPMYPSEWTKGSVWSRPYILDSITPTIFPQFEFFRCNIAIIQGNQYNAY